nr:MAG TPA: Helix-turn-helix XRE-family like protein [Caudoviricetes sp.]
MEGCEEKMSWLDAFNRLRKESGMSLDEISFKSGVPKGTLSKITSGITKNPSIETMRTLVHCMGYTLDDLDDGSKRTEKNSPNTSVSEEAILKDATEIYETVNKFAVEHNIDQKRIEKAIRILEILLFDD